MSEEYGQNSFSAVDFLFSDSLLVTIKQDILLSIQEISDHSRLIYDGKDKLPIHVFLP